MGGSNPPTVYKMGSLSRIVEFDVPKNVSTTVLKFAAGQVLITILVYLALNILSLK